MLSVRGLSVRYGPAVEALDRIELTVPARGVLAVLGANGSGKTTLLRAVSGMLRRHGGSIVAGEIRLDDVRLDGLDPARVVRAGIVAVPQRRELFTGLTVEENLRAGGLGCRSGAARRTARARVHELFPALTRRVGQSAGLLPAGEQQMLAIGRALMTDPKLLLLDEPSAGLDPGMTATIAAAVRTIHDQGTTVVLVEQNPAVALRTADHGVVLTAGCVTRSGSAAQLASADCVQQLYPGPRVVQQAQDGSAAPGPAPSRRPRSLWRWVG